jgi:hypothetical protein
MAKIQDTEWRNVKVTFRDPNETTKVVNVGGNDVIIDGKKTLKQFKLQVGKTVKLPVTFIEQLKKRFRVVKDENDNVVEIPIHFVEEV